MILQALIAYYETQRQNNAIDIPGWTQEKFSWAVELASDGQILSMIPLIREEKSQTKKKVRGVLTIQDHVKQIPFQMFSCPASPSHGNAILPSFLYGSEKYLFGRAREPKEKDGKKPKRPPNLKRDLACFEAFKKFHQELLAGASGPAAKALLNYLDRYTPETLAADPEIIAVWPKIQNAKGFFTFWYQGDFLMNDPELRVIWDNHYRMADSDAPMGLCSVTGRQDRLCRVHPGISGVHGGQAKASLVSYNFDSACSWGWTQGENAHVGNYAATVYALALNQLLADSNHCFHVGDTTVVCWAADASKIYSDYSMGVLGSREYTDGTILKAMGDLVRGQVVDWHEGQLDPSMDFYVLGLAPRSGRLSVRFFWKNSFGVFVENVYAHQERVALAARWSDDPYGSGKFMSIEALLNGTIDWTAQTPSVDNRLAGDMLLAVLNNTRYPSTLLNQVRLRIRADRDVSHVRMAAIKAYYLKNYEDESIKEVMTVGLNRESRNPAYVCGQLMAVLEKIQEKAIDKTTVHDRFFSSASMTPRVIFPTLMRLAQAHLNVLSRTKPYWYNTLRQELVDLYDKLDAELPAMFTLTEQGMFQAGYYHRVAEFGKTAGKTSKKVGGKDSGDAEEPILDAENHE